MKTTINKNPSITAQEIYEFLHDLSKEDKAEVLLVHSQKSLWDIAELYMGLIPMGDYYTMTLPCGKIIAMGGVLRTNANERPVWLLCTDLAKYFPKALYKACREVAQENMKYIAVIYRHNEAHVKFAERFGFHKKEDIDNDFSFYTKVNSYK